MKKNFLTFGLGLGLITLLSQCGGGGTDQATTTEADTTAAEADTPTLSIRKVGDSPEYMDAMLQMTEPVQKEVQGNTTLKYEVKNFELKAQTPDAQGKGLANSGDGQHIHLIVNNQPYIALYNPEHALELEEGHHTVLSFLSRSYHESVKNPEAYVLKNFTVGNPSGEPHNLDEPHLFYSRPKGTYSGDDTKELLLDFFLVNTTLSPDGNRVRATINGQEFMLDEWAPYAIEGLPMGDVTVKLELLDASGTLIKCPYNPVERTVKLEGARATAGTDDCHTPALTAR